MSRLLRHVRRASDAVALMHGAMPKDVVTKVNLAMIHAANGDMVPSRENAERVLRDAFAFTSTERSS